jgi:hypothetical protein
LPSYSPVKAIIEPSGEKLGKSLNPDAGSEAAGIAAVAADDPQIAGVVENNLRLADGGKRSSSGGFDWAAVVCGKVDARASKMTYEMTARSLRIWAPKDLCEDSANRNLSAQTEHGQGQR